jgi:hypothetical protein
MSSAAGPIPALLREKAGAAPELAEMIDDLAVIEKHRGVAVIVSLPGRSPQRTRKDNRK